MKTEYEIRVLKVNIDEIEEKLKELGAIKKGEFHQKRYVYDLKPAEKGKWIRLRTNGINTTLTYKDIVSNTIDGTKEVEIEVDDFEKSNELLERIGFMNRGYQENKRIHYILDRVEIDIDSWPLIDPYLEIEGPNEESVIETLKKLDLDEKKVTTLNCDDIYFKFYDINLNEIKELKFKEKED